MLAGEAGGAASLYFTAGDGLFYVCRVSGEAGARLTALAGELLPNRALFAFEQPELYEGLDPYVMILSEPPVTQTYEAYNPIGPETVEAGMGALLKGLSIQLQASSVYEAANGRRVRAGKDTLLIGNDGTVTFHAADSGEPRYPVSYAGEQPTAGELTETARTLVEEGLSAWCGEAGLYLMGAEQGQDGETAVYFGYLLDGAAVTVGAQGYAARVVFHGAQVSEYTFHYRAYRATGTAGAALPEVQAAAAMRVVRPEGGELQLRYLDAGSGQVSADWVVQS
ncbi:hypothetical protein SDC9_112406 [bioreactor metagenome]|uniref:Uncharacterized protein n=1 Tax=bioreactor metagenome TaxID=1076179 RepID=A0A645BJ62_9ZZZZ